MYSPPRGCPLTPGTWSKKMRKNLTLDSSERLWTRATGSVTACRCFQSRAVWGHRLCCSCPGASPPLPSQPPVSRMRPSVLGLVSRPRSYHPLTRKPWLRL